MTSDVAKKIGFALIFIVVVWIVVKWQIRRQNAPNGALDVPERRRKFKIHRSTAIVMMFVAGMILWRAVGPYDGFNFEYGWPFPFWSRLGTDYVEFFPLILILDFVIFVSALTSTWMFCEWLIRTARKEP